MTFNSVFPVMSEDDNGFEDEEFDDDDEDEFDDEDDGEV